MFRTVTKVDLAFHQCCGGSGSGIWDAVLFDTWIRDSKPAAIFWVTNENFLCQLAKIFICTFLKMKLFSILCEIYGY
jgi:hypothetical protein